MKFSKLPALNTPLDGGTFAGVITKPDGTHHAVVLLPAKGEDLTWKDAKAWAKEQGGELPSRPIAAMLFANVQSALTPEWHWTADELNASYAWGCFFDFGGQDDTRKDHELPAVAVRLIELEGC